MSPNPLSRQRAQPARVEPLTADEIGRHIAISVSKLGVALPKGRGVRRLWSQRHWALRDIDFELKRGESIGVLGRNGAGKTTLLRTLAGIIAPDQGTIRLARDLDCVILAPGAGFDNEMTGRENIYNSALVQGHLVESVDPKIDEIIDFAEMRDWIDEPVGIYSAGMRARLGFSLSLFLPSDILLIDETLSVGDVVFREKARRAIVSLVRSGRTVVVVSHNVEMLRMLCPRALLLDNGRQIICSDIESVIAEYHARNANLVDFGHTDIAEVETDAEPALPQDPGGGPALDEDGEFQNEVEVLTRERKTARIARQEAYVSYSRCEQILTRASAALIAVQAEFIDCLRSQKAHGESAAKLVAVERRWIAANKRVERATAERDESLKALAAARERDKDLLERMREVRSSLQVGGRRNGADDSTGDAVPADGVA